MADVLPKVPMLPDIQGMQTTQLQAYARAWEIPTNNVKQDDLRNLLMTLRLIVQGDVGMCTPVELRALYDAWGIHGDYSTCPPDNVAVVLIGYAAALAMRANAVGYCRTPTTITAKQPKTTFTGTAECDINVVVEETTTGSSLLNLFGER